MNYLTSIDHDLYYGQTCRQCNRRGAKQYATSVLGKFTLVTYRCSVCGHLQDTSYNNKDYLAAIAKQGGNK